MTKIFRNLWFGISLGILFGGYITLYAAFLWAYFKGNFIFSISINSMGEAKFELYFLTGCLIFAFLGIIQYLKNNGE